MSITLESLLRSLAGKAGSAIDAIGSKFNDKQSTSDKAGSTDWSSTLQNWGGNAVGSGFGLVKVAHAAEPTSTTTVKRNMSADGGTYDNDGNFTPYFPGTNTPDTSKTIKNPNPGNGGGDNGGGGGGGDNGESDAERQRQARIKAIQSRLQMMKEIADRDIATAGTVRDDLLRSINEQYGEAGGDTGLFGLSKSNLANSLSMLDTQDTNVQNQYGRAGGEARRAFESALGRNRMTARAQGALGSSNYFDSQADTTTGAARSIANIADELAGKRADIDTSRTTTNNWFQQKDLELGQEKTGLVGKANQDYESKVNSARDMERSFGIDSEEALEQAEVEYSSRLREIQNYIENKSIALAQIGATAGYNKAPLSEFGNTVSGTIDRMNSNTNAINNATKNIALFNAATPVADISTGQQYGKSGNQSTIAALQQRLREGSLVNPYLS